jgi:hypothetical protein
MVARAWLLLVVIAGLWCVASFADVLTYHNSPTRSGAYKIPALTLAAAANMHPDTGFNGIVSGNIYAQPLFWHPKGGKAEVIVATESNTVYALNASTGAVAWEAKLAASVPLNQLPCGNIDPDGITGTPVIDPKAGVLYLDALTTSGSGPKHLVYALSLVDGSVVSGWPLDVGAALQKLNISFSSSTQGERSALLLFDGSLYVNFGGNYGDCGSYKGTVVEVTTTTPGVAAVWQTKANGGGIWAQGGVSGDGKSVFATTGNTFGAGQWSGGEAIVRLLPGLAYSNNTKDFFAPSNWQTLDDEDLDLGGTEALPLNVAAPNKPPAQRVIAFGKDGNAYLANRENLGGVGGALAVTQVSNSAIITAPAIYETQGVSMVAFTNSGGGNCSGGSITMLNVAAKGSSPISVAWCAVLNGRGAPIVTTTDGASNAIVWVVGAEGDNELHGFDALTGAVVFSGTGAAMSNLHHFVTIMPAENRFYVASDNKVYAFAFQ